MPWLLVILLHFATQAEASHLCDEVKVELDYAVRRHIFDEQNARAIYLRCINYEKRNEGRHGKDGKAHAEG